MSGSLDSFVQSDSSCCRDSADGTRTQKLAVVRGNPPLCDPDINLSKVIAARKAIRESPVTPDHVEVKCSGMRLIVLFLHLLLWYSGEEQSAVTTGSDSDVESVVVEDNSGAEFLEVLHWNTSLGVGPFPGSSTHCQRYSPSSSHACPAVPPHAFP